MFGSSISSGIAGDVSVAEGIAIEEITEVNSFTAGKKLFPEIRCLVKLDMPGYGISFDCIPRPNARQRYVDNHHAAAGFRITADERIRHHATDIVTDNVNMTPRRSTATTVNCFDTRTSLRGNRGAG
jgi:hypothetical protein